MQAHLLELISDPVLTLRSDLSLLRVNPAARDWLGHDPGEGWVRLRQAAGSVLEDWLRACTHALEVGRAAPPAPALALGGGRHVLPTLLRDRPLWHLHFRPDIGSERHARAQAADAQAELAAWFDLCADPLLLADDGGLILRSNAAFQALCLGQPGSMHETSPAMQKLLGWTAAGFGGETLTEGPVVDPQGRTRWLRVRLRRLSAGARGRWLGVLEDHTAEHERDLAQQQLDALMDTAEAGLATFHPDAGWLRPPRRNGNGRPARGLQGSLQGISRDMVDPASLAEFERLQRALKKGEPVEARYQVSHPELGRRWLLTRVAPGQLSGGRRSTSVVTLDVTAQAQAESALQTRAANERAILDSVLVGIVSVGPQGIEWMNGSARRMFACELEDVAGQPMGVLAPDDRLHPFHRKDLADEEGQAEMFECQLQGRDGRGFWVIGNVVQTEGEDGLPRLTYALLDIDRRRQAEAQSRQAQATLTRIIEAAPLAISLYDADTLAIEKLNQAALDLAGRPEHELLGSQPEDLFGAEQGALIRADLQTALGSHAVTQREYRLGDGDHRRVWDARFLHLEGSDGTPEQLLLVASDVTEHRAAEEARLQAAIAQRELLVREVHHRIKNNLQGVAGLLQQIAARRPEVADVLREAVGQVQAIALVYGLQVGAAGPLMLRRVWEAIIGSVQRMRGRPIQHSVEGNADLWTLPEAESIPIALSLNELLGNALRHSPTGDVIGRLICHDDHVEVEIINPAQLPEGFKLQSVPSGVSGLGLVRALLPRRSAILSIEQAGDNVLCRLDLHPPCVGKAVGDNAVTHGGVR
ncbi:PAS domain-containing protein [Roseateles sp.]|uniref:PAS domain-containing sensor histidine kinase n=1 Tax=Roseateles sp. TaxID=1971397 RepID=UPI00393A5E48